jgi:hypothetical protein
MQMTQYSAYGFITFFEQNLRHIQWCAPLRFQNQVLKTVFRYGGGCLIQCALLILFAFETVKLRRDILTVSTVERVTAGRRRFTLQAGIEPAFLFAQRGGLPDGAAVLTGCSFP